MRIVKVLIANRGEIACRIMRSCRAMGLKTVAVYSDADSNARHVAEADEAIVIGPAPAAKSYLNQEAILAAMRSAGADAVHPGYGFLSENADFAEAVERAGCIWIGPRPRSIRDMGDKERAREIAGSAGVPIVPGSQRFDILELPRLLAAAARVGYPLLIKAAAGGGGIGMRLVDGPETLEAQVASAQAMAHRTFGDATIYLERYIANARHIEIQVIGSGDGSGVHFFDRDCSVQRRFQKIIEEAPAPAVPALVRKAMSDAALALVRHQDYRGAGTVEFIYDPASQQFFFLEMNTRIQVEHAVTEMITGADLVGAQIALASNEFTLPLQGDIRATGHALECRIYAEKPEKNFLPSPGVLTTFKLPQQNERLRIDHGLREGDRITPYYDPMIAKVIAGGDDRDEAIERMLSALNNIQIEGVSTNLAFLCQVLCDPVFSRDLPSTQYVELGSYKLVSDGGAERCGDAENSASQLQLTGNERQSKI